MKVFRQASVSVKPVRLGDEDVAIARCRAAIQPRERLHDIANVRGNAEIAAAADIEGDIHRASLRENARGSFEFQVSSSEKIKSMSLAALGMTT